MKIFNKNEWKKVKLGDVCDLRNGVAIKSEDYIINSNTLNCRMSNIRPDGTFDILYNAKYLPDNFSEKYKNYLLKNGDLVIAMTDMAGDPKILGVPTVVKSNGFNIIQNQRVGKLELLTDNIDENYLKFALQSKNVKNYFKKFSAGGVQLNLSKKEILNAPIVLPTIEEQKILVNLFKTIESFIYLRKKELLNLNSLNKSLFTTMFGDPFSKVINKEEEKSFLKDITIINPSKKEIEEIKSNLEISFITMADISEDGRINVDNIKKLEDVKNNFTFFKENDVLFAKITPCMENGKGGVAKSLKNNIGFGTTEIHVLRPISNITNSQWIYHLTKLPLFRKDAEIHMTGSAGQKRVPTTYLANFKIKVPPIELQNKFAERIEKIEKLKFEIEKSIETAQNLYDSLISKYFDN